MDTENRTEKGTCLLPQWLKENGYTMTRLAKETGFSVSHLSHMIKGRRQGNQKGLAALERVTGLRICDIWPRKDA